MARPPILTLADISLTFGGHPLFSDLSLSIEQDDRVALVGRNGSGKSTLMKIMAGLVEPDHGTRFLKPGAAVAYMEQDPDITAHATLGEFAQHGLPPESWHLAQTALPEGLVTDGQHLVHQQYVRVQVRRHREGQSHEHAAGISFHRALQKLSQATKLNDIW